MKTVVETPYLLVGEGLDLLRNGYVKMEGGIITEVGSGSPPQADVKIRREGSIIIPGLVNSHIHVGDSAFKDTGFGGSLDELFKPPTGLKHRLLASTAPEVIVRAVKDTLFEALRSGTTTLADFREGSIAGVRILLEALKESRLRVLIFGRPSSIESRLNIQASPHLLQEIHGLLEAVDGLAPSSPNDVSDEYLSQLSRIAGIHGKLRATHAAESPSSEEVSRRMSRSTEVQRAIHIFKAELLVHLTYASEQDLRLVAESGVSVAACPRANAALGLRLPPVPQMLDAGINVCLGTDNVMLNQPDMFREMEFALKAYMLEKSAARPLKPMEVLQMATINGARALRIEDEAGSIDEGKSADLLIMNLNKALKNTQDLPTAIVHRASADDVDAVIIRGEVVYDRLMGEHQG
ncbi:MAG: amidohydrolase family protein [Candidatus Bathyarchaeia archaeon]